MAGLSDIEEIMDEVEKASSGVDSAEPDSPLIQYLTDEGVGLKDIEAEDDINRIWQIDPDRPGGSEVAETSPPGSILRKIFRRFSKNYMDPLIQSLNIFHSASVRVHNRSEERIAFIENRLKDQDARLAEISRLLRDSALEVRFNKMERKISSINWKIKEDTLRWSNKKKIKDILDLDYLGFENIYRGDESLIKERQSSVVRFFSGQSNVLDIGCGRGEFLELMKERNISAKGIDLDEKMIELGKSKGLDVKREDALAYLNSQDNNSLGGIFLGQVVEHLTPSELIELTELCYERLKKDAYIVIETVNPLCLFTMATFYLDISHQKPVHPDFLRFHLETLGFHSTELEFISPLDEDERLKSLPETESSPDSVNAVVNENFNKLNKLLFSFRDYVIAAKK